MLFREPPRETRDPHRFRSALVGFTVDRTDEGWSVRVAPGAERAVELLLDLLAHLGSPIDVTVDDRRHRRRFAAARCAAAEVRDALPRLRAVLARYGGVGVSLEAERERLVLTPELVLEVAAPTDRWRHLLAAAGLIEAPSVPPRTWLPPGRAPAPIAAVAEAVADLAARLGLAEVPA